MWQYRQTSELYHHGILGQKWGQTNGPPYPLDSSDYSAAEKRAAKKAAKKDEKCTKKNSEKVTQKATKRTQKEMASYARKLLKEPNAVKTNGKLSAATINAYNKKMAELMTQEVSGLSSPSGRSVIFVAKRGTIGVYMALADAGYDTSQVKNGVWESGRVAYKKTVLEQM